MAILLTRSTEPHSAIRYGIIHRTTICKEIVMHKSDLIDAIADRVGGKATATEAVNAVLEAIAKAVASGDKVSITGWGSFEMVHKPARTARNPSNGGTVDVPECWVPKFKAGSDFKDVVNVAGKAAAAKKAA
jgi:DNA-binding protein HU-beta